MEGMTMTQENFAQEAALVLDRCVAELAEAGRLEAGSVIVLG